MADYVTPVITLVGGFILGWFGHLLTRKREADARQHAEKISQASRKHDFLEFLAEWKAEVMTEHPHNLPVLYRGRLPRLRTKAVSVRDDLSRTEQTTFDELISNLSGLTAEQIIIHQNKGARDEIGQPLDALIGFLEQIRN